MRDWEREKRKGGGEVDRERRRHKGGSYKSRMGGAERIRSNNARQTK